MDFFAWIVLCVIAVMLFRLAHDASGFVTAHRRILSDLFEDGDADTAQVILISNELGAYRIAGAVYAASGLLLVAGLVLLLVAAGW